MSIPVSEITDVLLLRHQAINIYSLDLFIVLPKIHMKYYIHCEQHTKVKLYFKKKTQFFKG